VKIKLRTIWRPVMGARQELAARFLTGGVPSRIPGFMAQTGDPTGTGSGGSDLPDLKAEFSSEKHKRGTVSAARTANPNSANSQFYICFDDAPWLDKQYSVWGEVVEGMDNVDKIKKGGEHNNGTISGAPDKILKARIETEASFGKRQSWESLAATKSARFPPA
jgi:peptidyl-prolyl cis-trans isomerase B (cyclophilin B)